MSIEIINQASHAIKGVVTTISESKWITRAGYESSITILNLAEHLLNSLRVNQERSTGTQLSKSENRLYEETTALLQKTKRAVINIMIETLDNDNTDFWDAFGIYIRIPKAWCTPEDTQRINEVWSGVQARRDEEVAFYASGGTTPLSPRAPMSGPSISSRPSSLPTPPAHELSTSSDISSTISSTELTCVVMHNPSTSKRQEIPSAELIHKANVARQGALDVLKDEALNDADLFCLKYEMAIFKVNEGDQLLERLRNAEQRSLKIKLSALEKEALENTTLHLDLTKRQIIGVMLVDAAKYNPDKARQICWHIPESWRTPEDIKRIKALSSPNTGFSFGAFISGLFSSSNDSSTTASSGSSPAPKKR